jgi:predicted nucleic acid-binding protein
VGVVVFDSHVLIGFLNAHDAHHAAAVQLMRESLASGNRRLLCAVNYSEILVGPLRTGTDDVVERMLERFGIETIAVDAGLARRAAAVRARTGLLLPDAYALATAVQAEQRGLSGVRLASFDQQVLRASAELHGGPPDAR